MIYQLEKDHYHIARPLLDNAWIDLAAKQSVIDGQREGQVFVDSLTTPTCGMITVHYGNYFLLGTPTPEFERMVMEAPAELGVFTNPFFHFFSESEGWHVTMKRLVSTASHRVKPVERRCFRLDDCTQTPLFDTWHEHVPDGFEIVKMTADLAEQTDKDLSEQFIGPVFDEWTGYAYGERYPKRGYENFVEKSVGYVALHDGKVICVAWASSISDNYACIDVETDEAYHGQGLATLTCSALLADFAARGLAARGLASEWIADEDNIASVKLALKLGHHELKRIHKITWHDGRGSFKPSYGLYTPTHYAQGTLWTRRSEETI